MARDGREAPWYQQLVIAGVVLVVVALVVGLAIGAVTLGAVRSTGLDSVSPGAATQAPSVFIPSGTPNTSPKAYPVPRVTNDVTPSASGGAASSSPTPKKKRKKVSAISLQGFPAQVSPGGRINLTGTYRGGEGKTLQVQQFQNGWGDFPVTVPVSGGVFTTYIVTSRTGSQRFRVLDPSSGRSSNPVTIRIG